MTPENLIERAKTYVVVGSDGHEVNLGEEIERLRAALSEVADRHTLSCDGGELDWLIEDARNALGRDPIINKPKGDQEGE